MQPAKTFLLGLSILINLTCFAQTLTVIDWKSDIAFLKKELPALHKNLFFSMPKNEYIARLDNIFAHLSELNDFEIAMKLVQTVAKIGDSHTAVEFWRLVDRKQTLPLQLYWFSDGLYILQTTKNNEKLLGSKITKINSFKIEEVIDSLSTLITSDNEALVKNKIPSLIPLVQLLKSFKFVKNDTISFDLESSTGGTFKYQLTAGRMGRNNTVSVKRDTIPLCWQHPDTFFYNTYIEKDKAYYLQYNKCWSKELEEKHNNKVPNLPSFTTFENNVFTTLVNKHKPIQKFIFDMRFNGGGNSEQGTEFIDKLSNFTAVNDVRKLYVVIGRKTFSSAIINTLNFKQKTKAILVGEETGGKPNHYGEVKNFRLPSSQLLVNYSTKYFTYTKVDLKTIKPDFVIDLSFEDYKKGIDPVYEWIIHQN